jgi:methoxymalonate biosynthesis acyl carrier protein
VTMANAEQATGVRTEIRAFIEENFLYMHPGLEVRDEDNLLALGVMDSLSFVELVEEVQERYGISVQDVEITEENFGSISSLVTYIEGKKA